jgi:hypothetical protein
LPSFIPLKIFLSANFFAALPWLKIVVIGKFEKERDGEKGGEREKERLINNGRVLSVHIYRGILSYRRFSLHILLHTLWIIFFCFPAFNG